MALTDTLRRAREREAARKAREDVSGPTGESVDQGVTAAPGEDIDRSWRGPGEGPKAGRFVETLDIPSRLGDPEYVSQFASDPEVRAPWAPDPAAVDVPGGSYATPEELRAWQMRSSVPYGDATVETTPVPGERGAPTGQEKPIPKGIVPGMAGIQNPFADLPEELRPWGGGRYFPPNYDELLAEAWIDGDITEKQYDRATAAYDKHMRSGIGLEGTIRRMQADEAGRMMQARAGMMGVEADSYAQQADAIRDASNRAELAEQQRALYMHTYSQAIEKQVQATRTAIDDINATKIDPFAGIFGGRTMAIIGAALGATAAGMAKTPNFALQALQTLVNSNLKEQSMRLEKRTRVADRQKSLLAHMQAHMGDMNKSMAASKAHIYGQLELKVQSIARSANSTITRKRADALVAGIAKLKEIEEKKYEQAVVRVAEAEAAARRRMAMLAAQKRSMEVPGAYVDKLDRDGIAKWNSLQVRQLGGFAGTPELKKRYENQVTHMQAADGILRKLMNYTTLGSKLSPADRGKVKRLIGLYQQEIRQKSAAGAHDKGFVMLAEQISANPAELFDYSNLLTARTQVEHAIKMHNAEWQAMRDNSNILPGKIHFEGNDAYLLLMHPTQIRNRWETEQVGRAASSIPSTVDVGAIRK